MAGKAVELLSTGEQEYNDSNSESQGYDERVQRALNEALGLEASPSSGLSKSDKEFISRFEDTQLAASLLEKNLRKERLKNAKARHDARKAAKALTLDDVMGIVSGGDFPKGLEAAEGYLRSFFNPLPPPRGSFAKGLRRLMGSAAGVLPDEVLQFAIETFPHGDFPTDEDAYSKFGEYEDALYRLAKIRDEGEEAFEEPLGEDDEEDFEDVDLDPEYDLDAEYRDWKRREARKDTGEAPVPEGDYGEGFEDDDDEGPGESLESGGALFAHDRELRDMKENVLDDMRRLAKEKDDTRRVWSSPSESQSNILSALLDYKY